MGNSQSLKSEHFCAGENRPSLFVVFVDHIGTFWDLVWMGGSVFDIMGPLGPLEASLGCSAVLRKGLGDPGRALKMPNLSPEQTLHHLLLFF